VLADVGQGLHVLHLQARLLEAGIIIKVLPEFADHCSSIRTLKVYLSYHVKEGIVGKYAVRVFFDEIFVAICIRSGIVIIYPLLGATGVNGAFDVCLESPLFLGMTALAKLSGHPFSGSVLLELYQSLGSSRMKKYRDKVAGSTGWQGSVFSSGFIKKRRVYIRIVFTFLKNDKE